jgi:glucosamine-6-phosphate deaminase
MVNRKKRLRKGIGSLQKQIELHEQKLKQAEKEGRLELAGYYEKEIKKIGIDFQILGMGRNGHIGFNEPGSSFKSKTRRVKLSEITRKDNDNVPEYALTMGLATIMQAKKIILLANGKHKADAIVKSVRGEISEQVPASILKRHKDATFIIDKKAASKL